MNMKYVLCVFDEKKDFRVSHYVYADLEKAQSELKIWQMMNTAMNSRITAITDTYCTIQESNYVLIAQIIEVKDDSPFAVGYLYRDDLHFFIDDFCDNESTALDTMEDMATNHFTKKSIKEFNTKQLSQPRIIKGYGKNETFDAYFVIDLNSLA